jgi:hypothetical protein
LVEFDESVEKSDCDEDATKIRVLNVILQGPNVDRCKRREKAQGLTWKSIPRRMYSSIPEMIRMMLNIVKRQSRYYLNHQSARSSNSRLYANLLQSGLLLGWRERIRAITLETGFCLGSSEAARLSGIDPVKRRLEQALHLMNGQ